MTALIVTAAVLLVLLLLLFSPVVLSFGYDGGKLSLKLRYIFIPLDLSPDRLAEKKAKKKAKPGKAKKEKPPKKPEPDKPKPPKRTAGESLALGYGLLKASARAMGIIRRHLVFYKIKITAVVGGPDAHKTGDSYALYCTLIPNLVSLLDAVFTAKEPRILIMPNFNSEKTWWSVAFKVKIAPGYILAAGFYMAARFVAAVLNEKQRRKTKKGGKIHEPTASHKQFYGDRA